MCVYIYIYIYICIYIYITIFSIIYMQYNTIRPSTAARSPTAETPAPPARPWDDNDSIVIRLFTTTCYYNNYAINYAVKWYADYNCEAWDNSNANANCMIMVVSILIHIFSNNNDHNYNDDNDNDNDTTTTTTTTTITTATSTTTTTKQ